MFLRSSSYHGIFVSFTIWTAVSYNYLFACLILSACSFSVLWKLSSLIFADYANFFIPLRGPSFPVVLAAVFMPFLCMFLSYLSSGVSYITYRSLISCTIWASYADSFFGILKYFSEYISFIISISPEALSCGNAKWGGSVSIHTHYSVSFSFDFNM